MWGGQISMSLYYDQPAKLPNQHKRTPAAPIYVFQDGRCLCFTCNLAGETLEVLSDGVVLYTSIIGEDGIVEIPASITGEVELRLVRGNATYHAFVEL